MSVPGPESTGSKGVNKPFKEHFTVTYGNHTYSIKAERKDLNQEEIKAIAIEAIAQMINGKKAFNSMKVTPELGNNHQVYRLDIAVGESKEHVFVDSTKAITEKFKSVFANGKPRLPEAPIGIEKLEEHKRIALDKIVGTLVGILKGKENKKNKTEEFNKTLNEFVKKNIISPEKADNNSFLSDFTDADFLRNKIIFEINNLIKKDKQLLGILKNINQPIK